jgi:hypothetical protein
MFFPSLGKANELPATTNQRQPPPLQELLLNKEVFTRGETLNLTIKANAEP